MKAINVSCLALLIFLLSSCQKLRDYLKPNNVEPPNCRVVVTIDKNNYPDESYDESIHAVKYNHLGDPELIQEIHISLQGPIQDVHDDNNILLYDDQRRLIQEGLGAENSQRPSLRRYVYEGDSPLPLRDTFYTMDTIYVEEFEYDTRGRIVRETRRLVSQPGGDSQPNQEADLRYYYDIRGNRQENPANPGYQGIIEYSDKPSLYSLHRVWQLRYRDYSRNSTPTAATYNDKGLPEQFADSSETYFQPFLSAAPGATVQYECEE